MKTRSSGARPIDTPGCHQLLKLRPWNLDQRLFHITEGDRRFPHINNDADVSIPDNYLPNGQRDWRVREILYGCFGFGKVETGKRRISTGKQAHLVKIDQRRGPQVYPDRINGNKGKNV